MAIKRLDHVNFISHDLQATLEFYCNIIGLEQCSKNLNNDPIKSIDLCIPGQEIAILHIRTAKRNKIQPNFEIFASLDENNNGLFSSGAFDHFCLAMDSEDYPLMLNKLKANHINYQTYESGPEAMKQIWILDPNGIRVELNF